MKYIYLAISIFLFVSCEDVIDLPLEEGPKRLVIDANINLDLSKTDDENKNQSIRLTQTTGYYDLSVPIATGATVKVENTETNAEFIFFEEGSTGIYTANDFIGIVGDEYELSVVYNGESFTAKDTLMATPIIDRASIVQSTENFFGTEVIKVEYFYQDNIDEENFYFNQFSNANAYLTDGFGTRSDEFTNGQVNSIFEQDDRLVPGDELILYFYGASKTNYNYMNLLLDQISSGGPFGTPPAAVKGNCINITDSDKKPYGYFRLSEMDVVKYTIQEIEIN